jgi:hypothetical protein
MSLTLREIHRCIEHLPRKTFCGENGPYLTRYVLGALPQFSVYYHQFHRADEDREFHNHPWAWAQATILHGGYVEERLGADLQVATTTYKVGDINVLEPATFHRVASIEEDTWSIIKVGPKVQDWGFKGQSGLFTPWREFVESKGLIPLSATLGSSRENDAPGQRSLT